MISPRFTPSRDVKYMSLAVSIMSFSKDPDTQVAAVIISKKNEPQGWGYNGPARPIDDNSFSWERPEKHNYMRHAEENALDHSDGDLTGSSIYVTGFPCHRCMTYMSNKGIKRVVYLERSGKIDPNSFFASQEERIKTLNIVERAQGEIELVEFNEKLTWLPNWFSSLKETGIFDKYII